MSVHNCCTSASSPDVERTTSDSGDTRRTASLSAPAYASTMGVIETNNYYPQQRDGEIAAIQDGQLESAWVAEQIGAPVYKVFNGIWWKRLLQNGTPSGTPGRIALPIAGAGGAGREVVHGIVDQLGFDPVDAGPISESWRQQPGNPGVRQRLRCGEHAQGTCRGVAGAHSRVECAHGVKLSTDQSMAWAGGHARASL